MILRAIALGTAGFLLAQMSSQAGGFFGPPPFTNGSPLPTGVAGTYQATARGSGISGLLRFSYGTGGNPSTTGLNDYVFFFQGIMIRGSLQTSIMDKKISGTLDAPTTTGINPTLADTQATGGFFNANIDTASPYYRFLGRGQLQTFVSYFDKSVVPPVAGPYVSQVRKFRVQGMRTSLND